MEPREIVRISLAGSLVILVVWHLSSHSTFTLSTDPAPTAFEALTMLRSSRPVRIRLQGSAPVRAQAYSRWRCVGDLETIGAAPHRTCVFERVCYHPNQSDFTFHARPGEPFPWSRRTPPSAVHVRGPRPHSPSRPGSPWSAAHRRIGPSALARRNTTLPDARAPCARRQRQRVTANHLRSPQGIAVRLPLAEAAGRPDER